MKDITVRVPATSANLGSGFDTLGLALTLYNTVTIGAVSADRVLDTRVVRVSGEGETLLATDATNLAYASARRVFENLKLQVDFTLQMHNEIPLSRGLGSSAAARVGGLVAANEWARSAGHRALDASELQTLATQLEGHPDNVCASLLGGLVVAACHSQNGCDSAVAVRVPVAQWPRFAVWIPDEHLPTKAARQVVPTEIARADAVFNISRAALLVAAMTTANWDALRVALDDRIHQNQRAPLIRGYHEIVRAAIDNGAIGATLSGAGSTILIWCDESSTRSAVEISVRDVARDLRCSGRFLWLSVDERGATVT